MKSRKNLLFVFGVYFVVFAIRLRIVYLLLPTSLQDLRSLQIVWTSWHQRVTKRALICSCFLLFFCIPVFHPRTAHFSVCGSKSQIYFCFVVVNFYLRVLIVLIPNFTDRFSPGSPTLNLLSRVEDRRKVSPIVDLALRHSVLVKFIMQILWWPISLHLLIRLSIHQAHRLLCIVSGMHFRLCLVDLLFCSQNIKFYRKIYAFSVSSKLQIR